MGAAGRRVAGLAMLFLLVLAAQASGDPYRPQQWHLGQIGAPEGWERTTGTGTVIAIVDSGIDLTHPDLVDRLHRDGDARIVGWDFVDDDDQPQDRNGHGTMVAGVAAAALENGIGVAGVAPDARLMPVRVLDEDGAGSGRDVDEGIRWAVDHGADVINLSLESVVPLPGTVVSQAPVDAVRYAWERGVVVVAAAGNSGSPFTDYPASSPAVLVGATDRDDEGAHFSDTGRRDAVMAPGVDIVSTWCDAATPSRACDPDPERKYGKGSGTSFAAPQVAAAIALLRSIGVAPDEAVSRIRATAVDLGPPGPDSRTGAGRLDIAAAVGPADGEDRDGGRAGPAEEETPDQAAPPSPSPTPRPTETSPPTSPTPTPAPSPTPHVTTVPAPGTGIEALDPIDPVSVTLLRMLAAALVASTGGLVLAIKRQLD